MMELAVTVLTLLVGAFNWYTSKEKQIEREGKQRDEDIAKGDHIATSNRLSKLIDRVRSKS